MAKLICQKIGVRHYIVDASTEFQKVVIDYFLKLLRKKMTPNPCIICNKFVKFKKLFEFAKEIGADYVATGHYARVKVRNLPVRQAGPKSKIYQLVRPKDKQKDQTYFLCLLEQKELSKLLFPLGDYKKEEVYKIAKKYKLEKLVAKKQSQDLCFVANKSIPVFLEKNLGARPGKICDTKGNVLGEHKGLHFYTIGQRKGINLKGGPFWVVGFDVKKNILFVTNNPKDKELFEKEIILSNVNYILGKPPKGTQKVLAKIRFKQKLAKAKLIPKPKKKAKLIFEKPQRAVTPGQWAVFYDGNVCLGGGMIEPFVNV
jgi:tRNA-specific 2-thiouridylase